MDEVEALAVKELSSDEQAATSQLLCEICKVSDARYRCPQCFVETCSVLCIKKHKQHSQCDGVARRTRHIPLSEMDDLALLNDYRLLEEAARYHFDCQDAFRSSASNNRDNEARRKAFALTVVQSECRRRRIKLELLPDAMEYHKRNTSNYNKFAEMIFWRVRINFPSLNNCEIELDRIPETLTVRTLLKQALRSLPEEHQAFKATSPEKLHCLMPVEKCGWTLDKRFYEVNPQEALNSFLKWKLVVEYPRFTVVEETDLPQYKILTDEMKTAWMREKLWIKDKNVTEFDFEHLLHEISRAPVQGPVRTPAQGPIGTSRGPAVSSTQGQNFFATRQKIDGFRAKARQMAADAKAFRKIAKSSKKAAREANPIYYGRFRNNLQQTNYKANYCRNSEIRNAQNIRKFIFHLRSIRIAGGRKTYHNQRQRGGRGRSFTSNYRSFANRNSSRLPRRPMPDFSGPTEEEEVGSYMAEEDVAFGAVSAVVEPAEPPIFASKFSKGSAPAPQPKQALSGVAKAVDFFNMYDGDFSLSDDSDG